MKEIRKEFDKILSTVSLIRMRRSRKSRAC